MTAAATTSLPVKRYTNAAGTEVEAFEVTSVDDMLSVRHSGWLDPGTVALVKYPSGPHLWVGKEPPLYMSGRRVTEGEVVVKGPAGDVEVETAASMAEKYEPVT